MPRDVQCPSAKQRRRELKGKKSTSTRFSFSSLFLIFFGYCNYTIFNVFLHYHHLKHKTKSWKAWNVIPERGRLSPASAGWFSDRNIRKQPSFGVSINAWTLSRQLSTPLGPGKFLGLPRNFHRQAQKAWVLALYFCSVLFRALKF